MNRFWSIYFSLLLVVAFNFSVNGQTIDPNAKPFRISGSLGGNLSYYSVNGIPERQQPYGYSLFGAVNMRIYNFSIPFSVAISKQGTSFSQPFSRFGLSPEYKWIKLHGGYRNLSFSEFTLNGVSFLGGGVELTPGKFRFAAMYGRLREAIQEPDNPFEIPQFKRMGYGFKIGYGDKSYFDLSFFQAKDDLNSLQNPDSLNLRNGPEASTSVGLSGKFVFADDHLTFSYDAGISGFTRDLRAPGFTESSENQDNSLLDKFNANTSSNAAVAGSTGLQYKGKLFTTGVKYRHVQAGYRTLGANYLLSDLEMITINAGTQFFKNKLAVNASYGIQNNDLSNRRFAQTGRNIGSANLSFRPNNEWNFNLNFSNFSIYQTLLKDSLFADSVVVDQTNYQVNFSTTYIIVNEKHTHSYTLNTNVQNLSDRRDDPVYDAGNQLFSLMFNYGLRFNQKNFGVTVGANYQDFSSLLTAQKRYGGNAGFNVQLMDRKLMVRLKQIWNRSVLEDRDDDIFNTQLAINYELAKKHTITVSTGYILRTGQYRFSEWRSSLGYRMRF